MNIADIDSVQTAGEPLLVTDAKGNLVQDPKYLSIQVAKTMYQRMFQEHQYRLPVYVAIEGLCAGNPPYNPDLLEAEGLDHIANFNNLDGRAKLDQVCLAYENLFTTADVLVNVKLKGALFKDNPDKVKLEQSFKWAFTKTLQKWDGFVPYMSAMAWQMVKLSYVPNLFYDEHSFKPTRVDCAKFYIPNQTSVDLELLANFAVTSRYTINELYDMYKGAKDNGAENLWCEEGLKELLMTKSNLPQENYTDIAHDDIFDMQRRIQEGDGWTRLYDGVDVVHYYHKEYSGKVSCYMFTSAGNYYLYRGYEIYNSMSDILVLGLATLKEPRVHSCRGPGHRILPMAMVGNQMDTSAVDLAKYASTPMLKGSAAGARDMEAIIWRPGQPTYIGSAEFVENRLGTNIEPVMTLSNYLSQKMKYNLGQAGEDPAVPDSTRGSIPAEESKNRYFRDFGLYKNNVKSFYLMLDKLYSKMCFRILKCPTGHKDYKYTKYFLNCLADDGVSMEIVNKLKAEEIVMEETKSMRIDAARAAGSGSQYGLLLGLQELATSQVVADFGPREMKEYKRLLLEATLDHDQVQRFTNDAGESDNLSGGSSLAAVENAIMNAGQSPVFSEDNDQRAHITMHLQAAIQKAQMIQTGDISATDADKFFTVWTGHMFGDEQQGLPGHVPFYARTIGGEQFLANPQIETQLKQLREFAGVVRKNAIEEQSAELKRRQEDAAQTEVVMTDAERKDFVAERDEARKDFALQSKEQRNDEANTTRARVMEKKVELDAQNDAKKIELNAQNNNKQETRAELSATPTETIRENVVNLIGNTPSPFDLQ